MCTYLYAAFSLKSGEEEGLSKDEAAATARWRRTILDVAIDEMGHLAAVWNITSALGGVPRFGRGNFPLDPGYLPAGVVVKLAPFNPAVLAAFHPFGTAGRFRAKRKEQASSRKSAICVAPQSRASRQWRWITKPSACSMPRWGKA